MGIEKKIVIDPNEYASLVADIILARIAGWSKDPKATDPLHIVMLRAMAEAGALMARWVPWGERIPQLGRQVMIRFDSGEYLMGTSLADGNYIIYGLPRHFTDEFKARPESWLDTMELRENTAAHVRGH